MEVIILAGGFGTRLNSVISNLPKPMAPINNIPFLTYLFKWLEGNSIKKVILSVGYLKNNIIDYYNNKYNDIEIIYSIEDSPLGTGGALKKAMNLLENKFFYLINGDTFFEINLLNLYHFHIENNFTISICLKFMKEPDRYSTVDIDTNNNIINFVKDKHKSNSYINGGVYLLNKEITTLFPDKSFFSFENDFLSINTKMLNIGGYVSENYFIDIGIPEDYRRSIYELKNLRQ